MRVSEHLTNDIKPLTTAGKVGEILDLMEELKFCHLPVLHNGQYVGLISEDDLLDISNEEDTLEQHLKVLRPHAIEPADHLYNAVGMIGNGDLTLLPVVDTAKQYLGYLNPLEIIQDLGQQLTFAERGSLVVLRIHLRDYHLSQIAQIIESEQARLVGLHIYSDSSEFLKVVLKINQTDISRILKAFERYEYTVDQVFHQSLFDQTASDRYDSLMKYLNI